MNPEPGRCPRCGDPLEAVGGGEPLAGGPMFRCRACGWTTADRAEQRWINLWWVWVLVGLSPAVLGPLVFSMGWAAERRDDAALAVLGGGIVCCALAGYGFARATARDAVGRLVVAALATGAFVLVDLVVGLLAACTWG